MPDTPTPTPESLPTAVADAQQRSRADGLRVALTKQNVSQAAADAVVKDQQQAQAQEYGFNGYVTAILVSPQSPMIPGKQVGLTAVSCVIRGSQPENNPPDLGYVPAFYFPPNDPKYLPLFERIQDNYPKLKAHVAYSQVPGQEPLLIYVGATIYPAP